MPPTVTSRTSVTQHRRWLHDNDYSWCQISIGKTSVSRRLQISLFIGRPLNLRAAKIKKNTHVKTVVSSFSCGCGFFFLSVLIRFRLMGGEIQFLTCRPIRIVDRRYAFSKIGGIVKKLCFFARVRCTFVLMGFWCIKKYGP